MAREGRLVPPGRFAGHIVASGGRLRQWASAERARKLLQKYGISINDAANGIAVSSARHGAMHTRVFHDAVEQRLAALAQRMTKAGFGFGAIRDALRRELRMIGDEFARGVFP
jgi:hypothetical protein